VVGRLLDAIYEAGPTELFLELMLSITARVMLEKAMCFHVDTTSISVQGEYALGLSEEPYEADHFVRRRPLRTKKASSM